MYDALGMCAPGRAGDLVDAGDNTYGGKYVVNPSGGLESKGHPLGATGIGASSCPIFPNWFRNLLVHFCAQGMAFYIVNQLRGWAGPLQAEEAKPGIAEAKGKVAYGLAHNLGLGEQPRIVIELNESVDPVSSGGACVVTVMKRPDFWKAGGADGRTRLGYNHAAECKRITQADVDRVKSSKFSDFANADL